MYMWTDGAQEDIVGIGGVLIDPARRLRRCFGAQVAEPVVQTWKGEEGSRVIHQAELMPVLVALQVWGPLWVNR